MALFKIYNGVEPTTAQFVKVATGTNLKTMLQVKPSSTKALRVTEWGISFDGSAAATPIVVELIEVDVAATVTAHVAAGIVKLDAEALLCGDPTTNLIQVGTSATGYSASAEGTITAGRLLDAHLIAPTNNFIFQWPLDYEPIGQVDKFVRIRVKAEATINAMCYMVVKV